MKPASLLSTSPNLPTSSAVLIDDRILVALLVGAPVRLPKRRTTATTSYWYYRACRAAVLGGSGQLSGPFGALADAEQGTAIRALLELPAEITLPDPHLLVPAMAQVHGRHRQLNLLNVEAAAAALVLGSRVMLSPAAAAGVLPTVLDDEGIKWTTVEIG